MSIRNLIISPTPSITASRTATLTPTQTTCPYVCCWPTTGSSSWSLGIFEMKPFADDESFWLYFGGSFNGQTIGVQGSRFNPCGTILNSFSGNCVVPFRGGVNSSGMYQQSDGKVIIYVNANLSRYNTNYTSDNTFNTIYLTGTGAPNEDLFGGCYVNPSDEIYIMGLFVNDPITECSGSSYNFNTNIYKIKKDGGIDTSYSGITIGTVPNITGGEPRLMTSENDPDGKVLVIRFSSFTGNSIWAPIMRMNPNGLPDPTFNNSAFSGLTGNPEAILTTFAQKDGKYMVGGVEGQMINVGGYANQDLVVRLNSDGSVDTSFVYGGGNHSIQDIEQDIEGNYHIVWSQGGPAYGYMKLSNTGSVIFNQSLTAQARAVMCWNNTVYVSGFQSMRLTSTPNYQTLLKFDLDGNLLMCPLATPTMTPSVTQTRTPSVTPTETPSNTPTMTNTPTNTATVTMTSTPTSTLGLTPTQTPSNTATQTQTPSVTESSTPTNTPTMTMTPSATSGGSTCECWTVVNEDTVTINYTYTDCDGVTSSPNLIAGGTRIHCISGGTDFIVNSPIGGLLGTYDCGTNCNLVGDCNDCSPTATPTETPTMTSTPTNTNTSTPSSTPPDVSPTATPTMTNTPSGTPSICDEGLYSSGQLRPTCSDYCNTNYNITFLDLASEPYSSLSIGDFVCNYAGQTGYLAVSNVSTDTATGPFKIFDLDGTGEILGIYVCSGGSCIPL
jgi:hypothetical protein